MGEQKQWRSEIQHGPDGETDYAWVHDEKDALVCIAKSHHATCIVRAVNTYPAVSDLVEALEYATGALQLLPTSERDIIKFTGKWERYGSARVADILDRANDALSRFHALGKGGAQ